MRLYFSRLSLNRHAPTRALSALLDPNDEDVRADANHRLIWTLFGDARDQPRDFLWRMDGRGRFYTLSTQPPIANDLFNSPETKAFAPRLEQGDRLHFTLRANATKDRAKVSRMDKAARRGKSRRVDVVMDLLRTVPKDVRADERMKLAQAAAEAWMDRQGASRGFAARQVAVEGYRTLELGRTERRGMTFGILDLTGEIEVTDPDAILPALAGGFGRAKAWGCGLMLIRRAR